jgi:hypothetical protein
VRDYSLALLFSIGVDSQKALKLYNITFQPHFDKKNAIEHLCPDFAKEIWI